MVKEGDEAKIPLERETLAGLLERWLDHIEARGHAPKTLLENRRMTAVITEELCAKDLRKLRGHCARRGLAKRATVDLNDARHCVETAGVITRSCGSAIA